MLTHDQGREEERLVGLKGARVAGQVTANARQGLGGETICDSSFHYEREMAGGVKHPIHPSRTTNKITTSISLLLPRERGGADTPILSSFVLFFLSFISLLYPSSTLLLLSQTHQLCKKHHTLSPLVLLLFRFLYLSQHNPHLPLWDQFNIFLFCFSPFASIYHSCINTVIPQDLLQSPLVLLPSSSTVLSFFPWSVCVWVCRPSFLPWSNHCICRTT